MYYVLSSIIYYQYNKADMSSSTTSCISAKPLKLPELDLSNVPEQEPILKDGSSYLFEDNTRARPAVTEHASKYRGVYYDKSAKRWKAQMMIDGRVRHLGFFDKEEEAGRCYAKAAYKFKAPKKSRTTICCTGNSNTAMDLSNVPEQPLIPNRTGTGYQGVKKCRKQWQARITYTSENNGQSSLHHLGTFDTAEEAAQVYAKAKYLLERKHKQKQQEKEDTSTEASKRKKRNGQSARQEQRKQSTTVTSTRKRPYSTRKRRRIS